MTPNLGTNFPRLGFESTKSISRVLGVPLALLHEIALRSDTYYRPFKMPKPDGGTREIDRPIGKLKDIQRRIHRRILSLVEPFPIAFGGVANRSHVDAVRVHVGREAVGTVDISSFFPSVSHHHVYKLMTNLECSPNVSRLLTRLLTYQGRLPQGSPASTAVANLILHSFDSFIASEAATRGVHVSRVVDDVAVSGAALDVRAVIEIAISELHRRSFRVRRDKTGIRRSGSTQRVCNVNVNRAATLPKRKFSGGRRNKLNREELRDLVRQAKRFGIDARKRASLIGKLRYAQQFHPRFASQLLDELQKAPDTDEGRYPNAQPPGPTA